MGADGKSIRARMADDGRRVLPSTGQSEAGSQKPSGFLRDLVAAARGNPGVALAIWRRALRARPEEPSAERELSADGKSSAATPPVASNAPAPGNDRSTQVWVVPFDKLGLPTVPQAGGDGLGLVLHALLLHNGLDVAALALVTGMPESEVSFAVARLARAELIYRQSPGAPWTVTADGYPSIRRNLQSWGFPVDTF